ncbi:copper chaperone PCu(A)C [Noviherbaspirillum sp.]|uniref:copper chaperone PCu(A)C n=1 Tax=Noviherbaspirillum sp. TaxID=1926288 RepID=UPI002FE18043
MKTLILATVLGTLATSTLADVIVQDAWARATVPGQPVGAIYMKISSRVQTTLAHAETDVAKEVQVHNMHLHDDVMKMREQGQIDIPAGKLIDLAPGGTHLMMLGLKRQLTAGEDVAVKLTFIDAKKVESTTVIHVPVRPLRK